MCEVVCEDEGVHEGRLFHAVGPATEKASIQHHVVSCHIVRYNATSRTLMHETPSYNYIPNYYISLYMYAAKIMRILSLFCELTEDTLVAGYLRECQYYIFFV